MSGALTISGPDRVQRRRLRARRRWIRDLRWSEVILLLVTMTWLLGTVAGFVWGPFKYEVPNRRELYVYLAAVHIAFLVGFLRGSRSRVRQYGFALHPLRILRLCGYELFCRACDKLRLRRCPAE